MRLVGTIMPDNSKCKERYKTSWYYTCTIDMITMNGNLEFHRRWDTQQYSLQASLQCFIKNGLLAPLEAAYLSLSPRRGSGCVSLS